MLTKKQLENYSKVMIWSLKQARENSGGHMKPGDIVRLKWDQPGYDLAAVIYKHLIQEGYMVSAQQSLGEEMAKTFYQNANDRQLEFFDPMLRTSAETINGSILVIGAEDLFYLNGIDPQKQAKTAKAFKPFRDILTVKEHKGEFGWTLCLYPTIAYSSAAGLSLYDFTQEIVNSCFLNEENPTGYWNAVMLSSKHIRQSLAKLEQRKFRVVSENMNLTVDIGFKRNWIGATGHNIPSFEIFTSPDWRFTEGTYYADMPSFRGGNLVEGVRLDFKDGKVVKATAKSGQDYLEKILETDDHARVVGEFSLTDVRMSKIKKFMANTLFDENHGGKFGNCHIALGSSYPETYDGDTKGLTEQTKKDLGFSDSAIHWDLINTEDKGVYAIDHSGKETLIYANGKFII